MSDIVRAARAQLNADGTITSRHVGSALGVSAAALYHHVSGISEIREAVAVAIDHDVSVCLARVSNQYKGDPVVELVGAAGEFRKWALRHPHEFTLAYVSTSGASNAVQGRGAVVRFAHERIRGQVTPRDPASRECAFELSTGLLVQYFGLLTLEAAGRLQRLIDAPEGLYWSALSRHLGALGGQSVDIPALKAVWFG